MLTEGMLQRVLFPGKECAFLQIKVVVSTVSLEFSKYDGVITTFENKSQHFQSIYYVPDAPLSSRHTRIPLLLTVNPEK